MFQNWIDHAPGSFYAGIAGEQGVVTAKRVSQQPLVRRLFTPVRMARNQLDGFAAHLIAGPLDLRTGRDYYFGTQLEAEVV